MKCTVFLWQFLVWCFLMFLRFFYFFFFLNNEISIVFKKERKRKNVCLQPWKPAMSWAASRAEWTAGQGRQFCLSALLSWDLTRSPALSSGSSFLSAQERCGTTGASAEEATKAEAPVLCRLRELGFSLEKALGRPYGTFQFQKRQGEGWRGTLWGPVGQGWTSFNWKKVGLD